MKVHKDTVMAPEWCGCWPSYKKYLYFERHGDVIDFTEALMYTDPVDIFQAVCQLSTDEELDKIEKTFPHRGTNGYEGESRWYKVFMKTLWSSQIHYMDTPTDLFADFIEGLPDELRTLPERSE